VYLIPAYSRTNPAKELEQREIGKLLDIALEQLSEKLRTVFILREVGGLSYQEIADTVGIPIGSVMSRLFHARQRLAEFLRPHLENGGVAARLGVELGRTPAPKPPKEPSDK